MQGSSTGSHSRTRQTPEDSSLAYKNVTTDEIELTDENENNGGRLNSIPSDSSQGRFNLRFKKPFSGSTPDRTWHVPRKWSAGPLLYHALPIITLSVMAAIIGIMSRPGFVTNTEGQICNPDGSFELSVDEYTPWKRDAIFAINMGYGTYSFGTAKFIDVVWDVFVGRGGQVLLAFFTYKVFTRSLSRIMENASVPTRTYQALTLHHDTIFGMFQVIQGLRKSSGIRIRITFVWILLSAALVLTVPTWLSAMTGYTAEIKAFVLDATGSYVPAKEFLPAIYTIHDGARLGEPYTDDYQVTVPWQASGQLLLDNEYGCNPTGGAYLRSQPVCSLLWNVSSYVAHSGFLALNDSTTIFSFPNGSTITLESPSLNISANLAAGPRRYFDIGAPYGQYWTNPITRAWTFNTLNPLFYHQGSDTAYNLTEFNENGACQAEGLVRYKWGFSFLLLYIFVIVFFVWTIDTIHRHIGIERAILDLSTAMHKRMEDEDIDLQSNTNLEKLMDGRMTYSNLPLDSLPTSRWTRVRGRNWPFAGKRQKHIESGARP